MSRPIYFDESVWVTVADGLRRRGWEVHTARDYDRLGATDDRHLALAVDNDWILFTFDDDFLALARAEGLEHAGIVYADQAHRRVGDLVKELDAFLENLDPTWRGIHFL